MNKRKILIVLLVCLIVFIVLITIKTVSGEMNYTLRINEILADSEEIEKKWLISKDDIPYDLEASEVEKFEIEQTYLCFDPEIRVRRYNNGQFYEFTVKNNMTEDGLVRDEMNFDITEEQYNNLISKKEGNTIIKTRYQLYNDGQIIAIDIFHGELDGLAYMEIEFPTEKEAKKYKNPDWIIKDVTNDINYKNGHLSRYGIPIGAYK